MPLRSPVLLFAIVLALLQGGCGTFVNLKSAPPPTPPCMVAPNSCFPLGGVTRSVMLGGLTVGGPLGTVAELAQGHWTDAAQGVGWTCVGVGALVDVPFSLAGDIVTLPIVLARRQGWGWATWWGDQSSTGWEDQSVENPAASPTLGPPEESNEPRRGSAK